MPSPAHNAPRFRPGIDTLLQQRLLRGRRVGLISHLAAVDHCGTTTAQRLQARASVTLACLMGPEHGFFGVVPAGTACRSQRHPDWKIPIHSLYGDTSQPRQAWLRALDVLVVDLQDLGYRPYTYVTTLKLVLEAAAAAQCPVIVADRPIPLPRTLDGPMLAPPFESFVSSIPAPMVYGMTPGETALWLRDHCCIPQVDVKVARMQGYHRDTARGTDWPPWMRPSPSIVSWESAMCFPATVCLEGLPHLDHGRRTDLPFQLVGAAWIRPEPLAEALNAAHLPGVQFHPHRYTAIPGSSGPRLAGVRLSVTSPARFQPVRTGITLLHTLAALYGHKRIWHTKGARPEFFDKLMGTDAVRQALQEGTEPAKIAAGWKTPARTTFSRQRKAHLLYAVPGTQP